MSSLGSPPPAPTLRRPLARTKAIFSLLAPEEVGPIISTWACSAVQPVSSSSSRIADCSIDSPESTSPTSPAGISMVRACSGIRNCSTNSTLSSGVTAMTIAASPPGWVRSEYSQVPRTTMRW